MNSTSKNRSAYNNTVKVISILAWVTFITIANINHQMIEAFLLSVAVVVVSYLIQTTLPSNNSRISSDSRGARKNDDSSNNNYLQVFFNTPIE